MNIYYIDYENVSSQGLKGVELLSENDEVILLYSKKADHVKIDILTMMMESKAKIRFLPVHVGTPNALDFQLVTELGYRISKNESDRFVIVTNDTGFDAAVKYWRRSKKSVKRITGKECKNLERRRREDLEWRNASDRTRDHVNRAVTGEEAETAAASSAVSSADPAEMQDVRPSRPVLRDAETAAEPEAEEADFVEEDFDSIPENEDEDYDPDFEEEEDDTDETASDEVSSDEMSADNESIYDDSDEETGSERTMNPFMMIQTKKPVLKTNTTPMTTVMRSIQIRNPFLRMNLMRNRFLNMMMQIWAVRILNHLLSVPLRISKSPIPPMQVQAWIPRSLPPFQRQKMEKKIPTCGMT